MKNYIQNATLRNDIHKRISHYLSHDMTNFKIQALTEISEQYPNIKTSTIKLVYDEEYTKWVDSYCD